MGRATRTECLDVYNCVASEVVYHVDLHAYSIFLHMLFFLTFSFVSPSSFLLTAHHSLCSFFQMPQLSSFPASPSRAPVSGGTMVTISGTHLDAGSNSSVTLGQSDCEILNIRLIQEYLCNMAKECGADECMRALQ